MSLIIQFKIQFVVLFTGHQNCLKYSKLINNKFVNCGDAIATISGGYFTQVFFIFIELKDVFLDVENEREAARPTRDKKIVKLC